MRISGLIKIALLLVFAVPGAKACETIDSLSSHETILKVKIETGNSFEKGLYKSTLDISKHHMSGFIFLKKTSDSSFRIIFSNQIGMKFFDFEIVEENFIVHYCFPSLNRKPLLKILRNDFITFLFPFQGLKKTILLKGTVDSCDFKVKTANGKWIYGISNFSKRIIRMNTRGRFIQKTSIRISYLDANPSKIIILNPTIRLTLEMDLIAP